MFRVSVVNALSLTAVVPPLKPLIVTVVIVPAAVVLAVLTSLTVTAPAETPPTSDDVAEMVGAVPVTADAASAPDAAPIPVSVIAAEVSEDGLPIVNAVELVKV